MKTLFSLLLLLIIFSSKLTAQDTKVKNGTVSGKIISNEDSEPLLNASVQIYSLPDSTFKTGVVSSNDGGFSTQIAEGRYFARFTYIGYLTQEKDFVVSAKKTSNLGEVKMKEDVIGLKEALVTADVPPVTMSEDTMVYNSAAFRVPAGSALEELIKKYPGVEIAEDGTIKVNGKTVNRILMKGKDFFGTDKNMALKNVPVDVVEKVKVYDKQSDFKRITGIDDGEEETVIDLQVKKGANQGFFGNADVAAGNKERYSAKAMTSYFTENQQYSLILSANNVNDRGFSGGGGGFRGSSRGNGLVASKMGGINFATDSEKLELGGNVRFNHSDNDTKSFSNSEHFLTSGSPNQYSTSQNKNFSRSSNINANFRLEWKPDTLTNIIFRPSISYSTSDNWSKSNSATFNQDPFKQGVDYLLNDFGTVPVQFIDDSIAINSNDRESMSNNESKSMNAELQLNRRLAKPGRNVTLQGSFSYSDAESNSISSNKVKYYQQSAGTGYNQNRYSTTPNSNWNYNVRASYTEPILKNLFLQLSYRLNYSYQNSDRSTYILDDVPEYSPSMNHNYQFPLLPSDYEEYRSDSLSRFSIYRNLRQDAQLMFRFITAKMNVSAGVTWMPQQSQMTYQYMGLDTILRRTVYNFTPTLRFRYRWSKTTTLNMDYRGSTSQPSMTDLLDVTDDSDPLNISKGNPALKPSFTNRFDARFNTYNADAQQGIMANMGFSNTLNDISRKVTYNEETGGRTTRPDNINGNWNAYAGFNFNSAIPANTKFTYSTATNGRYSNDVAYISVGQNSNSVRNTTKTYFIGETLRAGYRNDWFEMTMNGYLGYTNSRNQQQPKSNLDTYNFSYGPSTNVTFPWQNLRLSTDFSMSSRRGYSDPSFNTNELLWNAQLSMSFLKANALTATFQLYDILRQQSNVSRAISATSRSDTQYNAIHSYCMLHLIFKFNQMGNKETRQSVRMHGYDSGGFEHGGGERMGRSMRGH